MKTRRAAFWLLGLVWMLGCSGNITGQDAPKRRITKIVDDLYWAQSDNHCTVFLVTQEGIILSDPISREYAEWLKSEFARRFKLPVRYVLYTHHHWDHASGGGVFADTAEFVGHEAMKGKLALPDPETALPAEAAELDVDGDGRISPGEAEGELKTVFRLFDADGDGKLNGAEVVRGPLNDVCPPQTLFSDRKTISLGGKTVEMIYVGPTHSEDMTVLRFPDERAVFVVDFISIKRLPYRNLPVRDLDELLQTIRSVEEMDFDIAIPGHGLVGSKEDVAAHRRYYEELRAAVAKGIAAGMTLEELQRQITMDGYREWINYEQWLPENIAGMFAILTK